MRRTLGGRAWAVVSGLALAALSTAAQQGQINPRIPPPPPPPERSAPPEKPASPSSPGPNAGAVSPPNARLDSSAAPTAPAPAERVAPPPPLPASVTIPGATRIAVVLDTPLSTRIAKLGQQVRFLTSEPLQLADPIELPPDTEFIGRVVEARRPGAFGKSGALRVKLERINLPRGVSRDIVAHLDSPDMKSNGRLTTDNKRTTDLMNLASYTLQGTLIGARIKGGKGAAVGAGAGAAVALIIAMAQKGADIYLEPGMPFSVVVERPVDLPGADVYGAQQNYSRAHHLADHLDGAATPSPSAVEGGPIERDPDGNPIDPGRPKLKRRQKLPQP